MDKKICDPDKRGMTMGKAILKLTAYVNCGMLTVHILKARHVYATENPHCQPYVQVCLAPDTSGGTKCCTAVNQNSPHCTFNEKFSFELLLPQDSKRRLHVSVWNCQASESSPAEFLGAMSFGLNSLLSRNKEVGGWYYLLKEDIGRKKHLPAVVRGATYGEIGSPLQSPDCPETPLLEPKHTRIAQNAPGTSMMVADIMVHRDFNGNSTDKTDSKCLDCPTSLHSHGNKEHYFDRVGPNGQRRCFHSSFRVGRRKDHTHSQFTSANLSPVLSSKHVRFTTTQSQQNQCNGGPKNLPAPEKSALKSPPMRRSQNPFVMQYRQEIASVEQKVLMNSQKIQQSEKSNTAKADEICDVKGKEGQDNPPDLIQSEELTSPSGNDSHKSVPHTKTEAVVPESVMGYPSQFRQECLKATSGQANPQSLSKVKTCSKTADSKEIWIDCQSLESTNTTQDSGICDSSPKTEEKRRPKYQETSFCDDLGKDKTVSVYKDAHLEPSAKCQLDFTKKHTERFEKVNGETSKPVVTSSSQGQTRSKPVSASVRDKGLCKECETCTVKYYRQMYSPVLGQRRLAEKPDKTHTKVYFL